MTNTVKGVEIDPIRKKLIESLTGYSIDTPSDVEFVADHLLANDVVPVVRCKDCKFYELKFFPDGKMKMNCENNKGIWTNTQPDDFCSYGERREEE